MITSLSNTPTDVYVNASMYMLTNMMLVHLISVRKCTSVFSPKSCDVECNVGTLIDVNTVPVVEEKLD